MRNKNWVEFNNQSTQNEAFIEQVSFIKSKKIKIHKEKKGNRGKIITVVSGFETENLSQLKELLKNLKVYCGTGGKVENRRIQLQGDIDHKIKDFLRKDGYEI